MKAMIFAAGRGERMRPLTDSCPKPLLKVHGKPLIVWHIEGLVRAGIVDIVINHAYLGHMIEDALGDGSVFGAHIIYSPESVALETAGAIAQARSLLGEAPFVALAADVFCPQFDFKQVKDVLVEHDVWGQEHRESDRDQAWLYLVPNPSHHPEGDFTLNLFSLANHGYPRLTFSGIGVYRPQLFKDVVSGEIVKLAPILRAAADRAQLGGELYHGNWCDVGTVARLESLNL